MSLLQPAVRDRFDQRFPQSRWEQLRREIELVFAGRFSTAVEHSTTIGCVMHMFEHFAVKGVLEAGIGGHLIDHFLRRTAQIVRETSNIPLARGQEQVLAAAIVELAVCACRSLEPSLRGTTLLNALWRGVLAEARARACHRVYLSIERVMRILEHHRKAICVKYSFLWSGFTTRSDRENGRVTEQDLARILGIRRASFARRKSEGIDLIILLCLLDMQNAH